MVGKYVASCPLVGRLGSGAFYKSHKIRTFTNITSRLLKEFCEICSPILCEIWNNEITSKCSPGNLKLADRIPVQEKEDPTHTKRYRPVSALFTVSKMKKIFKVK